MPNHDLIVIGGGTAGLTAAIHAASSGRSVLVIDRMGGGGELMNLGPLREVETQTDGPDLAAELLTEAISAGAELRVAEVTGLSQTPAGWRVTAGDETHSARAVIAATGLAHGTLGLADEPAWEGHGLSHCAACDGPLFSGQPVVVAGGGRWARQDAIDLAAFASKVTLINDEDVTPVIEGITVVRGRVAALEGQDGLDTVLVETAGAIIRIPARGVFVQTRRRADTGFAPAGLARDPDGRLITNDALETNLPNLFAAGDARAGAQYTIAAAMGDGRQTAISALGKIAERE